MLQIALLRGINLGGKTTLLMADLRALLEAEGFTGVRTLLQSGQAVLDSGGLAGAALEAAIEAALQRRFGRAVDVVARTAAEWGRVVADNPFPETGGAQLLVTFLKSPLAPAEAAALEAAPTGPERVKVLGREIYVDYGGRVSDSKLVIKPRGTARNWNTVLKIAAALG